MGPTELEIRGLMVEAEGAGTLQTSLPGTPCCNSPTEIDGAVIAPWKG